MSFRCNISSASCAYSEVRPHSKVHHANAFEYASSAEIKTVALTAFDGGKMKEIADQGIHIPTGEKEYGPAEDLHMILDHLVGSYLTRLLKM